MFRTTPPDGRRSRWLALCLVAAAIAPLGCSRDALLEVCPEVGEGELVISELRGPQENSNETYGHYIEVYNASGGALDLQGLRVRLRSADEDTVTIVVRDSIELAAGGYAVIAPGDPDPDADDPPDAWVDYALGWDISGGDVEASGGPRFPDDLLRYASAFVEIESCGELIDVVFFGDETLGSQALPPAGSLACGNQTSPPSAAANDNAADGCWCVDDQEADGPQLLAIGLPGSPGEANRCP